ncbi:uncharacterized protein LOC108664488, partial [Hyalella azteca]|uniref:Uncharacterized protein LOC108664488 n=1 Tax=Hyalella azteca TaxID=294128 RepID=A0A8B7MYG5_HYAAZ
GPFCACLNSANNTYWCVRTINATHNTLYCEFITGLITYYDLNIDPYQLRNVAFMLSDGAVVHLHDALTRLRSCRGAGQCDLLEEASDVASAESSIGDELSAQPIDGSNPLGGRGSSPSRGEGSSPSRVEGSNPSRREGSSLFGSEEIFSDFNASEEELHVDQSPQRHRDPIRNRINHLQPINSNAIISGTVHTSAVTSGPISSNSNTSQSISSRRTTSGQYSVQNISASNDGRIVLNFNFNVDTQPDTGRVQDVNNQGRYRTGAERKLGPHGTAEDPENEPYRTGAESVDGPRRTAKEPDDVSFRTAKEPEDVSLRTTEEPKNGSIRTGDEYEDFLDEGSEEFQNLLIQGLDRRPFGSRIDDSLIHNKEESDNNNVVNGDEISNSVLGTQRNLDFNLESSNEVTDNILSGGHRIYRERPFTFGPTQPQRRRPLDNGSLGQLGRKSPRPNSHPRPEEGQRRSKKEEKKHRKETRRLRKEQKKRRLEQLLADYERQAAQTSSGDQEERRRKRRLKRWRRLERKLQQNAAAGDENLINLRHSPE